MTAVTREVKDICSPPWQLHIACSGLFTVVVLAALGRTSLRLAPAPSGPLSPPLHACAPAGAPSALPALSLN